MKSISPRFTPYYAILQSILVLICIFFGSNVLRANPGDSIHVETVQFTGSQSGVYLFPPDSVPYQKVLINYTEKCPCGQWDYLEYVIIHFRDTVHHDTVSYEILRFITPYGIGINGSFTWTMDVTDYTPLLHDSVWLSAGNGQEAVDVSFDIIAGTPPRNVLSFQPLWTGSHNYGFIPPIDSFFVTKRILIPGSIKSVAVKGAELKVIQTGHGFGGDTINEGDSIYSDDCSEFCGKMQNIWVRDTLRYNREVWRNTCGLNPVAAQGGTWPINRSNWCPGSIVTPFDYELTPYITPGDSVDLQIKMEPYTFVGSTSASNSTPYYVVSSFLCLYSAPNNSNDASVEDIIQPTLRDEYRRLNPICGGPIIVIRNSGGNDMKSLDINYGVKGGNHANYHWTGDLPFMQSQEVNLPPFDWGHIADTNTFEVTVSNPNGQPDQYSPNNYVSSQFILPPMYDHNLEVRVFTNFDAAPQYVWSLTNSNDSVVAGMSNLLDSTLYVDSLYLPDGCYTFQFVNNFGYGISWWATSNLGSGWVKLTSLGADEFDPSGDFGQQIYQQFRIGPLPTVQLLTDSLNYGIVDTTSSRTLTAYITSHDSAQLIINNITVGGLHKYYTLDTVIAPKNAKGQWYLNAGDTMAVKINFAPVHSGTWHGDLNVGTNDQRTPGVITYLVGMGGSATSVQELPIPHASPILQLSATPNVSNGQSIVSFSSESSAQGELDVMNAIGQTVAELYRGVVSTQTNSVAFSTKNFSTGMYYIVMKSAGSLQSIPLVIMK